MNTLQPNRISDSRDCATSSSGRFAPRRGAVDVRPARIHVRVSNKNETAMADSVAVRWFVYLFALQDGSAFELGFSCDPLDHLRSLAPRFHERFDLQSSVLLSVDSCVRARQITAKLEQQLFDAGVTAPRDLGHIACDAQWFDAAHFGRATQLLAGTIGDANVTLLTLAAVVGTDLSRLKAGTETWAFSIAKRLNADIAYAPSPAHLELARSLRDCLDAYRALRVPLFANQPEQANFVWQIVRLFRPALAAIS